MDPPSLPMIAYIFIGLSVCVLTYVTNSEEIDKMPNAIAEATSSVVNSTANSIKTAAASISAASGMGAEPEDAPSNEQREPPAPMNGGSKKRRRSKKRKNTKKNKSSKK